MRYVSEQFKDKQNQLIRPPLKMYFSIAEDLNLRLLVYGAENFSDMDSTVAPVKQPSACGSDYYYAVVGDGIGVDVPNKICAPDDSGGSFSEPTHLIPFGVSIVASANQEILVGSSSQSYYFSMGNAPVIMCFKGGLIPEQITVEKYVSGSWVADGIISNPDLNEVVKYDFASYPSMGKYRLKLLNTTKGGRYQVNWFYASITELNNINKIVFNNNRISSVSISEETDLTSQALPTYEMTVTCLDVNNEFSPESNYWNKEFLGGQACYLKLGYEVDGEIEYAQMFFGSLSKEPIYDNGKITFYVSIPMALSEGVNTSGSYVNGRLFNDMPSHITSGNPGDLVSNREFTSTNSGQLFDSYNDIFADSTDENNSVYNHYASIPFAEARQLAANALGGYIMAGFGTINLYNTNNIQYKQPVDYVTRYEQVKATLESQAKVGKINIVRNENTMSSNYDDVEASERVVVSQSSFTTIKFIIPNWEYSKVEVVSYQPGSSSATFTEAWLVGSGVQTVLADGTIEFRGMQVRCNNMTTTVKPIVRFYRVDNKQYVENESVNKRGTETYTNDNNMITNTYTADKAKRVARFMSDVSNQYEVDVIQDVRYELGDVIRLETEKNVFKTCVITGLKFNFPGSKGHVTCRKIFSIEDSAYAISDVNNSVLFNYEDGQDGYCKVVKADNGTCVVGLVRDTNTTPLLVVIGGQEFAYKYQGSTGTFTYNISVTDNNNHVWRAMVFNASVASYEFTPVDLGRHDTTKIGNLRAYGVMTLIMKLYEEQGMTSPVDYDCAYTVS